MTYPSEKYEFVSWDDEIPNIWKNEIHVPKHQPGIVGHVSQNKFHRIADQTGVPSHPHVR